MHKVFLAALTGIAITYALVILPVVDNWMIAKAQNTITPENKTSQGAAIKMIIKDNIVRIINTTTNETISVRNLTENTGNTTTNDNLGGNETTSVSNLTGNTRNTTTNENLTTKFNELQGK
jgi:hypothetical protein